MRSFVNFKDFVRYGGHGAVVLSLCSGEPVLEVKQAPLDDTAIGFELRLRDLAAKNWLYIASVFAGAGVEVDPEAENAEGEISRYRVEFEAAAGALLASDDKTVADADIASLADWLAHRFVVELNERRQRQLGVTHYIWRSQDDNKVRPAHAERDDRVFAWDDAFADGPPGHSYNCRCRAEPAILDGNLLLIDFPVSRDIADKIRQAQADGLAGAAADAVLGTALSTYSVFRFSYLGYRRLFGVITPEEEAERLAMREGIMRALDTLSELDADAVRQMAEAFADHFEAQHANLRLLDLEFRLGLAPEDDLLKTYHDVAYMDASTLVSATAFASVASRLGLDLTRLRPRAALIALRSATARLDELVAVRRTTVSSYVASRFSELKAQGHGPQRHEGSVTRQMLIDRVLRGIDPMTGTRVDAVTGRLHLAVRTATRITNEADFVAAETFIRRSAAYRYARDEAIARMGQRRVTTFEVTLPIEDALGPDFANSVEGVRRIGSVQNPGGVSSIDFRDGRLIAVFEIRPDGGPALVTMYPLGRS
jgi:SPP1 gp7 family putative phage head morphogenesis protein